ncbi:hypothetical protein KZP23_09835 [Echinicola marina]|uniref:hypothetical protein n=1 Tax=Echinicola marina TaxID=2859768 RepID=UPI001CF6EECE|nr:hypothetical protein [Echinicola marina]UCS95279.1 hypothetical protein KZP23_09835 [Echinicola marina]
MNKFSFLILFLAYFLSGCSCNPEALIELIANSSMFKGQGEVMAIGHFNRIEANFQKNLSEQQSKIELRLYNGKLPELYENEANIARKCAKAYIEATESQDYKEIEIFIIKTSEEIPPQTLYQSSYLFEVASLSEE